MNRPAAEREAASAFGENLARERHRQGKSTRALARLAGMHGSEISRIENGLRDPKVSTVVRLARALNVRVCELIEGPSERPSAPYEADDSEGGVVLDRIVYRRLGEALRQERRRLGLRQDDVALAAGLGLRAVGEIEAGKPTAQFNTWLAVIQALSFKLVVVRKRP